MRAFPEDELGWRRLGAVFKGVPEATAQIFPQILPRFEGTENSLRFREELDVELARDNRGFGEQLMYLTLCRQLGPFNCEIAADEPRRFPFGTISDGLSGS